MHLQEMLLAILHIPSAQKKLIIVTFELLTEY